MRILLPFLLLCACTAPQLNVTVEQIPTLTKLDDVMHVQSTYADPQFKKMSQTSFTDAEWTELGDVAARIQATAAKSKDFTKGPGYDALATDLGTHATSLGAAVTNKDAAAATTALGAMKNTCRECHSKFR